MSGTFMHELLIVMNMVEGEHRVTGAQFKNLTVGEVGGQAVEIMGSATGIDLAKPEQLATALGDVNVAVVGELNALKVTYNETLQAAQALQAAHDTLTTAHGEQSQQLAQALATADGQRILLEKADVDLAELRQSETSLLAANEAADQQNQTLSEACDLLAEQVAVLKAKLELLQQQIASTQQPATT